MGLAALFVLCRFVHFAAVMLMFGTSIFTAILAPQRFSQRLTPDVRPLLVASVWAGVLSAACMLAIQAGLMGDGWMDVWQPSVWLAVLSTSFGKVWCWHLGLAALSLLALLLPPVRGAQIGALLAVLLLVSLAFIGHAVMHDGVLGAAHRINHALHLLAAGYWFGCLLPLLLCLRYLYQPLWRYDAIHALIRFSRWGHLAVALVILTGIVNGLLITGQWPLNPDSTYQRLLLFKAAAVAVMVAIAAGNRYALVPLMKRDPALALRGLVWGCWAEVALGAVALMLVSVFATYSPR